MRHRKEGILLVVDDEPDLREILGMMLEPIAAQVRVAPDGREALRLLESERIDAVLSDINMPGMSGLELLAQARAGGFSTPFVMLTAFGDRENMREALRLGATDFLDKPFGHETLLETVGKALALGVAARKVDEELDSVIEAPEMAPEQSERLREIKRAILLLRAEREIYMPAGEDEESGDK